MKAFLLLQAHFERITLPITDYLTDTISVLDQSIRVLQAYIDITAEQGCLSTTLTLIKTMVSVKQAIWDDANPGMILPGVDPSQIHRFTQQLVDLPRMRTNDLNSLARRLGVPHDKLESFRKVAHSMPTLEVNMHQPDSQSLKVELHRSGPSYGPEFRAYAPLFPKAQSEGWFVFICDHEKDEILALKRASFTQHSRTTSKLGIPAECYGMKTSVLIVSDTYPGVQYLLPCHLRDEVSGRSPVPELRAPEALSIDTGAAKTDSYAPGQQLE